MGKGGGNQFAPVAMLFAFAEEHSVAEQRARKRSQNRGLLVIVDVFDENFRDQFRGLYQHDANAAELSASNTFDPGAQRFQHTDAIGEERAEDLKEGGHSRSLGQNWFRTPISVRGRTGSARSRARASPDSNSPEHRRMRAGNASKHLARVGLTNPR